MATDNKQKVLIRSMSVEELENYLVNSDLNGKITPKNEDTWHQNYGYISSRNYAACILSNKTQTNNNLIFLKRNVRTVSQSSGPYIDTKYEIKTNIIYFTISGRGYPVYPSICFRPLIEYKE
mgnify:CR=1 FL=1